MTKEEYLAQGEARPVQEYRSGQIVFVHLYGLAVICKKQPGPDAYLIRLNNDQVHVIEERLILWVVPNGELQPLQRLRFAPVG